MATRLAWHGERVEREVQRAVVAGVNETALRILALATLRAPWRTGHLRSTGFVRPAVISAGGDVVASVGFSASYAAYVELGTYRMAARPYLRPAFDTEVRHLARRIRAAL